MCTFLYLKEFYYELAPIRFDLILKQWAIFYFYSNYSCILASIKN
jgi:hypothetical protein